MNNKDKKLWLNGHYPTTIVQDRYTGVYSGGKWTCWPLEFYMVPKEIDGYDTECSMFWDDCDRSVVGFGSTPDEALKDLELKFYKSIFNTNKASK